LAEIVRFDNVTKRFGRAISLDELSLHIAPSRIVGLVGTNGSGKSTLLRHIVGMYLPTRGEVFTLGSPARKLEASQLSRIGMMHQHEPFVSWMTVTQLLRYVRSFYKTWDRAMERQLADYFELDPYAKIEKLSPGQKQRLAILLATCHRPELLLLDEPLSDLDPLARENLLQMLLGLFRDSAPTIVVSSHLLHDIEKIVDHVVALDAGKLILDEPLDRLQERFAEWTVTSLSSPLPHRFTEPWILAQTGDNHRRTLVVNDSLSQLEAFRNQYGFLVEVKPMNLDRIFMHVMRRGAENPRALPAWIAENTSAASAQSGYPFKGGQTQ
jgi:ABC-2 type transport system ATP-binding protein